MLALILLFTIGEHNIAIMVVGSKMLFKIFGPYRCHRRIKQQFFQQVILAQCFWLFITCPYPLMDHDKIIDEKMAEYTYRNGIAFIGNLDFQ